MQKLILRFLLFLAIQAVIFELIVSTAPPPPRDVFFASTEKKVSRMRTAESPRVILVGGSNLPLGIESNRIEEQTQYHPVNMGLHYLFGLRFQLRQAERLLEQNPPGEGKRDLVLLSLEWGYYGEYIDPHPLLLFDLIRNYPPAAVFLSFNEMRKIVDEMPAVLGTRLRSAVREHLHPSQYTPEEMIYIEGRFNRYGDIRPEYRQSEHEIGPLVLDATRRSTLRTIRMLNEFAERADKLGADTAVIFPPTPDYTWETSSKEKLLIEELLKENADFPVLNTAQEAQYPRDLFLDTVYHLNDRGSTQRSNDIAEMLNRLDEEPATTP